MAQKRRGAEETRAPEDIWFAAMEANLQKIDEFKKRNIIIGTEMEILSERRRDHGVAIGNIQNQIRGGVSDKAELRKILKDQRMHHRWNEMYGEAYKKLEQKTRLNVETIELLMRQLYETPLPGEEPLVYLADEE